MNVSLKRIQAIFIKDYKEFSRNYAVSIMILFPIAFALLYGTEAGDQAAVGGALIADSARRPGIIAITEVFDQPDIVAALATGNYLKGT